MTTAASKSSSLTITNPQRATLGLTHREPVFGLSITPNNEEMAFTLAKTADQLALDIIGIQDHPYNGTFVFWPSEGEEESQLRLFAERVVPKVCASLAEKTIKTQVA